MLVFRGASFVAVSLVSAGLALTPRSALADTFTLYTVDHSQSESFQAGDDQGDFILNAYTPNTPSCGVTAAHCFKVGSVASGSSYYTTVAPALGAGAVNGSMAPSHLNLGANWTVTGALGGIFAATYHSDDLTVRGIFDGTDPRTNYLGGGSLDGGLVSKGGTVYFIDGFNNTLDVALDTSIAPAPEPGTITLLGSGAWGLLAHVARRRKRPTA